ncbi:Short-chain dehydrogenase/reductase 2 [Tolypocladium paradoxum]|uniref:Short-chain dehydrogenase/reductase 3 n=1 Tax=Tolypocladium paradoxum TaxID=94208 RepID=A0A2S4KYQ5_9HYPO|nr:Short-chain dehydrogenase/reductase 2 [Tolypocladium paradoxum]
MSMMRAVESPPFKALHYLQQALLSPVLSGPLLLALVATPESVRRAVLRRLSLPPTFDVGVAEAVLQVLLGLGLVRCVNNALNSMAANCWRMRAAKGWDWPKEVAVVTGGCSGIGYGIVERLVRRQVKVAILDIQDLPKSFEGHPHIRFYKCDITSPESVAEAADAVRRDLGHPSILINNAGITRPMSILKMPQDYLHKIFNVNCLSHWTTVQQFLPRMIQLNKGHVVTVASIASFVALANAADYSATKAAAHSFHEALATELKQIYKADNVLTSVVHPYFVRTPLVEAYSDALEKKGMKLLTPEQVADAIAGQVFSRRGGQLILPDKKSLVSGFRGWPTWLQVLVRDAIGKSATSIEVH